MKNNLIRSLLYVPGSNLRKIQKALSSAADCITFDLEDGVAYNDKETARETLHKVLSELKEHEFVSRNIVVRVNDISTREYEEDMKMVCDIPYVTSIVLPKVEDDTHVEHVLSTVRQFGSRGVIDNLHNFQVHVSIESPISLLNISSILKRHNKYIGSAIFSSEDYSASSHLHRSPNGIEMLYARQKIVAVSRAYDVPAIDMVCIDYKNMDQLTTESRAAFEMGFTGKQCIHPGQISIINTQFMPSQSDIEKARGIMQGYNESVKNKIGAFNYQGIVIDLPIVKWAKSILEKQALQTI